MKVLFFMIVAAVSFSSLALAEPTDDLSCSLDEGAKEDRIAMIKAFLTREVIGHEVEAPDRMVLRIKEESAASFMALVALEDACCGGLRATLSPQPTAPGEVTATLTAPPAMIAMLGQWLR